MSAAQRQKVVYIFAGVIIAITVYVQFGVKVKKVLPEPVPTIAAVTIDPESGIQPVVAANGSTGQTTIPLTGSDEFTLKDGWGDDPFAPRGSRKHVRTKSDVQSGNFQPASPSWRLGGIIFLPSKPVAYVNDRPVHIGEQIDGALVADITRSSVILNVRGERKTLTLGKG